LIGRLVVFGEAQRHVVVFRIYADACLFVSVLGESLALDHDRAHLALSDELGASDDFHFFGPWMRLAFDIFDTEFEVANVGKRFQL